MIYKAYFLCLLKKELLQQLCDETNLFIFELNIFECFVIFMCFLNFL